MFLPKPNDVNRRNLLLEGEIDGEIYVLVNFYNNSIESDQIHTFSELNNFLDKVPGISIKK